MLPYCLSQDGSLRVKKAHTFLKPLGGTHSLQLQGNHSLKLTRRRVRGRQMLPIIWYFPIISHNNKAQFYLFLCALNQINEHLLKDLLKESSFVTRVENHFHWGGHVLKHLEAAMSRTSTPFKFLLFHCFTTSCC